MRETKQKTAILEFLRSKRQHHSAIQIYDAVREKIPNISLGTVYRNLGALIESGEIISVETNDKCVFYDGWMCRSGDHAGGTGNSIRTFLFHEQKVWFWEIIKRIKLDDYSF